MAENDSGQDKTEEATAKRKQDARDKGEIARSRELNTLLLLFASGGGLLFFGENIVLGLMDILRDSFTIDRAEIFDPSAMLMIFGRLIRNGIDAVFPLYMLLVVVAILAPLSLGGWSFTFKPLTPDLKKMDPIKGIKKVFSLKSLMELGKALAKFLIVGSVGVLLLQTKIEGFMGLGSVNLQQGLAYIGNDLIWAFILLSSALILVVLVDVPFQLWDHAKKQKMTRQEVKDEQKDTDGNPEMKGKVRQTQFEISQRRMMQEVPNADVVITNPTHYAVALKYDQINMGAPIIVALGADEVAGHIRRIAEANNVPMLSAPPLARALFHNGELDMEIPAGLYLAVAQVLAYVYQLNDYELNGGVSPAFDADTPIPDELRRDE